MGRMWISGRRWPSSWRGEVLPEVRPFCAATPKSINDTVEPHSYKRLMARKENVAGGSHRAEPASAPRSTGHPSWVSAPSSGNAGPRTRRRRVAGNARSALRGGWAIRVLRLDTAIFVVVMTACDPSPPEYVSPLSEVTTDSNGRSAAKDGTAQGSGGTSQAQFTSSVSRTTGGNATVPATSMSATSTAASSSGGMSSLSLSSATGISASGASGRGGSSGGNGGARGGTAGASSSASGNPSATPSCSGRTGAQRGKSTQSVTAAGVTRTFVQYVPEGLDPNKAAPIVIVPHGWLMPGEDMYKITQYDVIADRERFVVLYPDGEPLSVGPWNVGEGACPSTLLVLPTATGDDQAFVDAMIDFVEEDQCVDRAHVFMSGFSMGGYFSNETGCLRKEIAAIGPHSGGSHDLSNCPSHRKPVILFHGTSDGLIPVACGKEARDRWVTLNGCKQTTESQPVKNGHCEYSQGCPADGQVVLCLFDGMDHGWAGGAGDTNSFPNYESAAELGWSFFTTYAW
jgi:polyhydroxybutyrate depolymerase